MKTGITVHCVVKNEEQWIWYALMSVLDKVDRVLLLDTGSTDKTLDIVKTIDSQKIQIEQIKVENDIEFPKLRQRQIEQTDTDWIMVLDGDEIWQADMLDKAVFRIKQAQQNILASFVHYFEFVKDTRHYYMGHEQKRFPLHNRQEYGWYAIRFMRNIENLVCEKPYGLEGYFINGQELQRYGSSTDYIWNDDVYYFHARNLLRSSSEEKDKEVMQRVEKRHFAKIGEIPKIYRGIEIKYPEVFSFEKPTIVPDIKEL
jgi:glycosyltransferase involved in cell wall biosynthesis